ncbi:MAG: selenocysteine-specific translation elongation factor, partial [Candidatus Omnitrophica bacterium]|nr:selenocysteine-specific translation elongation factor [Candidatus Omnitrophota bacterium]
MNYFVIGTAGHVDHGKTALIKALTGIDCDRLKEEKQRGMTIDIGFSYCNLANGDCVEIIDVPGHERFIKNMLAGTGAIDAVLLVIAANEGVMPQTREHLGILTLLGIKNGIVVITKVDLVETEWLELVKEEIRGAVKGTFLEKAEIIEVSAITGQGMQRLKSGIEEVCRRSEPKDETAPFRLPIDRVFIKEGSGTIVTGTVISGTFKTGDELEVFPSRNKVRVRQIGTHNLKIEQGKAGQRVGFNLVGVKKEELMRGNILAEPGYLHPSTRIDARIRLLPSCPRILKNGSRIRLYLGTGEFLGRVFLLDKPEIKPNETGLAQLRMDAALAAVKGERFVLRFYAPMVTIGGGEIIDPAPQSHRRFDKSVISLLQEFEGMSPQQIGPAQARLAQKLLKENIV